MVYLLNIIECKNEEEMKELYNDIFISRQKSLQFVVSERDKQTGSRIGGYAPSYFDDDLIMEKYSLQEYVYYFSIGVDLFPILLIMKSPFSFLKILNCTIETIYILTSQ